VNFWQPSARAPFTNLPAGTPFLFKLKRPYNHIAGGGYFSNYTTLLLSQAWDFFGAENGSATYAEFEKLITANAHTVATPDRQIGCTVVSNVVYFPREAWIPVEGLFPNPIMVGKQYDPTEENGALLWAQIEPALRAATRASGVREEPPRYGEAFLQRGRLGQGAFRTLVLDAYDRRCALTGESTLPVLEAAHIRPYSEDGRHLISNGLLLRSDFHKLFDLGLVTVYPDYRIRVSSKIRDLYFNGRAYYRLDGKELAILPRQSSDHPDPEALRWHNENRFMP
jgi:putative restriction endonuclease